MLLVKVLLHLLSAYADIRACSTTASAASS
jgi:hypothetical protein